MPRCSIIQSGNDYAVKTPFSRAFVDLLKVAVPPAHRSFDRDSKAWIIEKTYADACLSNIIFECFGEKLELPELKPVNQETKYSFQLDYVGIPKERDGQAGKTALGFSKGQWRVIFSESILKEWFERVQVNTGEQTLFSLLGVYESATDQEIKSGYRRLARQWHPDVCKEENAKAMFKRISDAYQILSDPQKRARYQAGLAFERESNHEERRGYSIFNSSGEQVFVPPLRCGFLTVTGSVQVGRLRVAQILKWEDVTNEQGQTMVSSWSKEREAVVIEWV